MAERTPLQQFLYDTGIAAPGDVERRAQQIEASDWLERRDQSQREQGWNDALNAIAWCVENGSPNYADAIEYVGKNNAHRKQEPNGKEHVR